MFVIFNMFVMFDMFNMFVMFNMFDMFVMLDMFVMFDMLWCLTCCDDWHVMFDMLHLRMLNRKGWNTFIFHWPLKIYPSCSTQKRRNSCLLSSNQFAWINSYHRLTRDTIRPLLTTDLAKAWLMSRTEQFTRPHLCSSTTILSSLSVPVTFSLTTTLSLTVILTGVSSMKKCADT